MKKTAKKTTIRRETVRVLTPPDLAARGGEIHSDACLPYTPKCTPTASPDFTCSCPQTDTCTSF